MKRFVPLLIAATVCLGATTACSRRSSGPDIPRTQPQALEAAKKPVNLLDRNLRRDMASELQSVERTSDGYLNIAVNLRNRTYKPLHVQARAVFKDGRGISTGDESQWDDLYFAPQQAMTYRQTSRRTDAELYTVEVRMPRKPGK